MQFGPVNSEGGERRLNVLFSRSRVRCEIFASFEPGDIDLARTQKEGPRVLKRFLEYAKSGIMEEHAPTGEGPDSPFEEDVAREIRKLGYLVDYQVGSAGFRIDLGVRHADRPGQYFMAVECDGATYHSALWARERDRLRQEVLEHLGWTFHRIWSTDWFHRREQEISRLANALMAAKEMKAGGITVEGANEFSTSIVADGIVETPEELNIEEVKISVPPYKRTQKRVFSKVEPHLAPLTQMADLVALIVEDEGPLHIDEVGRRVAVAFGKTKAGKRINETTVRAFGHAKKWNATLLHEGDFVMTSSQKALPPVRDRSAEVDGIIKAEYLPPVEIIAAAELILKESGNMPVDELVKSITRVLGFKRTGPKVNEVISRVLERAELS